MYLSHDDLMWMLRRIYGQRYSRETLLRKFSSHSIFSLLPYYDGIEQLFDTYEEKNELLNKIYQALNIRISTTSRSFELPKNLTSYRKLVEHCLPRLIQAIASETCDSLQPGVRVMVKPDSSSSQAKPCSEGLITNLTVHTATVRLYAIAGRYSTDTFSVEIDHKDLIVVNAKRLIERHQTLKKAAEYFLNDAILRALRTRLNAEIFAFAANLAIDFLLDNGFLVPRHGELFCSLDKVFPALAPNLARTYTNPQLFSSPTLSSPPSERKAHVLALELTTGCDYNQCTFCTEYHHYDAKNKNFEEFKQHVDQVLKSIGSEKSGIQRLFIGSGNSLGVETELLLNAINYACEIFQPQKISLYGRTASILDKSLAELTLLKEAGVSLIYWGLESGSDEVLKYVNKGCKQSDMITAAAKLNKVGIDISAMLIPGIGGVRLSEQHLSGTTELLHNIDIKYLTLMAINPDPASRYTQKLEAEKDNRHMTANEVNQQVYALLSKLNPNDTQIGMFTEEIDLVGGNTRRFNTQFNRANKELLLRDFWN